MITARQLANYREACDDYFAADGPDGSEQAFQKRQRIAATILEQTVEPAQSALDAVRSETLRALEKVRYEAAVAYGQRIRRTERLPS